MMKNLRRSVLGSVIVFICLAAGSGVSTAASPSAPKREAAPAMKRQVEDALGVLGGKITRKTPADNQSVIALLARHLSENPYIYGAAFAIAPVKKNSKLVKSSPYIYRSEGKLMEKNLMDAYDYTVQDWYVLPVTAKKPVWSEPYYDKGGGDAWMITYAIPIYSRGKHPRLIGVLTSDLLISNE